jgi:hypothetical protein
VPASDSAATKPILNGPVLTIDNHSLSLVSLYTEGVMGKAIDNREHRLDGASRPITAQQSQPAAQQPAVRADEDPPPLVEAEVKAEDPPPPRKVAEVRADDPPDGPIAELRNHPLLQLVTSDSAEDPASSTSTTTSEDGNG